MFYLLGLLPCTFTPDSHPSAVCKNHLTSVNRKESVQQNPNAQSFFCEVFGEDLNEGKRHLRAQETNTHTQVPLNCNFLHVYGSQDCLGIWITQQKKNQQQCKEKTDLTRSRMINISATYGSVCHHCMPRKQEIQWYARPLKRCWKENWNTQEEIVHAPLLRKHKNWHGKIRPQYTSDSIIWSGLNIYRLYRVLEKTSASHLHLADLRNWGGVASAASDTSLTCRATSWRHQDVNVEEWKSKEWV